MRSGLEVLRADERWIIVRLTVIIGVLKFVRVIRVEDCCNNVAVKNIKQCEI